MKKRSYTFRPNSWMTLTTDSFLQYVKWNICKYGSKIIAYFILIVIWFLYGVTLAFLWLPLVNKLLKRRVK
jgi:hypothetical protein